MSPAEVPQFTQSDFTDGEKPYALLYAYRNDKFAYTQLSNKLNTMAKSVGYKEFLKTMNAYKEMQIANDPGVTIDNVTEFSGQPIELLCGDYRCDDDGIAKPGEFREETVCPHPILPVRRLVNVDGGGERLDLAFRKGFSWRSTIQEKATIASATQILRLANEGVVVNSENAKSLSSYILWIENKNYETIPEVKSVGRLGWIGDHGFSPYVEGLQFDGENSFKRLFGCVKESGEYDRWLSAMLAVRRERTPARFCLAASFASALIAPTGQLPFFVHLYGKSGTGKTVALMIAASVWANPDSSGGYISTFNTTAAAQEARAGFLNSLPMCIDELQIQSAQGIKDFDGIIYTLTEGVPKGRSKKEGGLRDQDSWKNCMISSGEQPISHASSGGGAVNRIIEVECNAPIYSDCQTLSANLKLHYGFAGKIFVEWLQKEGNMERAIETQRAYFRRLLDEGSTDKQAASASLLLTADELVTEILFKDGNGLTMEEVAAVMKTAESVDAGQRAYESLMDTVLINRARFYPRKDDTPAVSAMWGNVTNGVVYLLPKAFRSILAEDGYDPQTVISYARAHDLLVVDGINRNNNKTFKFEGVSQKGYAFKLPNYTESSAQADEDDEMPF